jgi:hypothetical protein
MKYVAILAVVIFIARIDYFLGLFDKANQKIRTQPSEVDVNGVLSKEVIPVTQDTNLRRSVRETFFALVEDFQANPTADIRLRCMEILKSNTTLFSDKLDKELEVRIFQWREHLNNNQPEVVNFILDLMNVLKGENLEILRRFFALWMDINMEHFIPAYSRTKDSNCQIATLFGENVPEEEVVNEYVERLDFVNAFLAKEKLDPSHKALASNCALQLKLAIEKLAPPPALVPDAPAAPDSPTSTTVSPDPAATASP